MYWKDKPSEVSVPFLKGAGTKSAWPGTMPGVWRCPRSMNECVERWTDGRMDGGMGRQMDRWVDKQLLNQAMKWESREEKERSANSEAKCKRGSFHGFMFGWGGEKQPPASIQSLLESDEPRATQKEQSGTRALSTLLPACWKPCSGP